MWGRSQGLTCPEQEAAHLQGPRSGPGHASAAPTLCTAALGLLCPSDTCEWQGPARGQVVGEPAAPAVQSLGTVTVTRSALPSSTQQGCGGGGVPGGSRDCRGVLAGLGEGAEKCQPGHLRWARILSAICHRLEAGAWILEKHLPGGCGALLSAEGLEGGDCSLPASQPRGVQGL